MLQRGLAIMNIGAVLSNSGVRMAHPAIEKLHRFIGAQGELRGKHHEIYLSDIRRSAPEKWKTLIRQPMR